MPWIFDGVNLKQPYSWRHENGLDHIRHVSKMVFMLDFRRFLNISPAS